MSAHRFTLDTSRLLAEHQAKLEKCLFELLTQHTVSGFNSLGVVMCQTGNPEQPYRCRIMVGGVMKAIGTGRLAPEALTQALQDYQHQKRAED